MDSNNDTWSLKKWRSDATPEVKVFSKNESPNLGSFRRTFDHICYFTFSFSPADDSGQPSTEDFDALQSIEETEFDFLTGDEIAVFVASVTVRGVRDFIFYTDSPAEFLSRAGLVRERHPKFVSG